MEVRWKQAVIIVFSSFLAQLLTGDYEPGGARDHSVGSLPQRILVFGFFIHDMLLLQASGLERLGVSFSCHEYLKTMLKHFSF